uniref:Uncharacterized protein n=1 Tax=Arundo donax TaxID=35708 RepID=A0A0A8XVY5_ARUDO
MEGNLPLYMPHQNVSCGVHRITLPISSVIFVLPNTKEIHISHLKKMKSLILQSPDYFKSILRNCIR